MKHYTGYVVCLCLFILNNSTGASAEKLPAASAVSSSRPLYFAIQIQASSNKDQAQSIAQQLAAKGYSTYTSGVEDTSGKIVYQVRIGKFKTRKEAEAAGQQFYKKEKRSYWITGVQAAGDAYAATMNADPASALQNNGTERKKHVPAEEQAPESLPESAAAVETIPEQETEVMLAENLPQDESPQQQSDSRSTSQDKASAASSWPKKVSKIYTYRGASGAVGVTNALEKIPREFRTTIESVSLFPVNYVSFDQRKKLVVIDINGKEEKIKLAGVSIPSSSAAQRVAGYAEKNLKDKPLRLKYTPPADTEKQQTIHGFFYFHQGTSINLDMLRQGNAACDLSDIPPSQHQMFSEAEATARRDKAGIWAQH